MRARTGSATLLSLLAAVAITGFLFGAGPGVQAQVETLKQLQDERVALAAFLTPSVVAVATEKPRLGRAGAVTIRSTSAASGFVIDGEYVVSSLEDRWLQTFAGGTTSRQLKPGESVWMMAFDGTEFSGKVVGVDRRNLLLLIKMGKGHPKLPSLEFANSDKVKIGSTAVALGNTLDSIVADRVVSFSYGTVSGFYRFEPIDVLEPDNPNKSGDAYKGNVLEIDAARHQGDAGGPVVNLDGQVIGMQCAHHMSGRYLACAVPSNQLRAVLPQLKKGVAQDDLSSSRLGFKVKRPKGSKKIYLSKIEKGGPAAKAGIPEGWELVRIDNFRIPNFGRIREMLGVGYIVHERRGGSIFRPKPVKVVVSYGVPVGTHIQLTVRNPEDGTEKTFDLITEETEEDF